MHLTDGRAEEMARTASANDGVIPCHKTLDRDNAVCRGFFEWHSTPLLRLAAAMGIITWQDPDAT